MPANPNSPTFPGVYIKELPSGVRTITPVATSITAFVGQATSGPVNKAVRIHNFAAYESRFGGLSTDSPVSYAVNQFFQNGGSEAWIVRLAKNAKAASLELADDSQKNVLKITAIDEGTTGNLYQVAVDYDKTDPNNFNLTLTYVSPDNPSNSRTETFKNVSMGPNSTRFVEDMVNDVSQLVTVTEEGSTPAGGPNLPVPANPPGNPNVPATAAPSVPNRPAPQGPSQGTLTTDVFGANDLDKLPDSDHTSFKIGFNGHAADTVVQLDKTPAAGSNLGEKLDDIAQRIQKAVRTLKPGLEAWRKFTCTVSDDKTKLVFTSGTIGTGSSVEVADADAGQKSIFKELHLDKAIAKVGSPPMLSGGKADSFTDDEAFGVFFGDRAKREGIYALDEVDLFNLLCLPGETDPGILAEAISYCVERRAFCIIDSPPGKTPDQMVKFITDPNLPKGAFGEHAAIYYPWVRLADPLKNGKLTSSPPSGLIAGLYARTDSTRGVWKAPAGTEATLLGVQAMDHKLSDDENGDLNPLGVNCLRIFPVYGPVCWGSRTVSGADQIASDYKYVPVRRLALFIEESLYRGTQWVVFEPNDEPLWAQIRLNVGAFMHNLFVKGAFQGRTPKEAYLVKCDKETTTQNDIDLGIVNILVGFAPLKPAEFVIISIQQIAGQLLV